MGMLGHHMFKELSCYASKRHISELLRKSRSHFHDYRLIFDLVFDYFSIGFFVGYSLRILCGFKAKNLGSMGR